MLKRWAVSRAVIPSLGGLAPKGYTKDFRGLNVAISSNANFLLHRVALVP